MIDRDDDLPAPTEAQLLYNIWERSKKIDAKLEWIRDVLILIAIMLGFYLSGKS